jgi:hypothetical protein
MVYTFNMNALNTKCKSILFLGYDRQQTSIINKLENAGCTVKQLSNDIDTISEDYDLVISFGYRFIINQKVLENCSAPVINLHMSLLPWNRGAHPNFWSFWDNTPSGVTIHLVNSKIDAGLILFQASTLLDPEIETFRTSYNKLFTEIENLFDSNMHKILNLEFNPKPQRGVGTFHYIKDFPMDFAGWDSNIKNEIERLESVGFDPSNRLLTIIDEIEKVRSLNNVNWMNLLRIVAVRAPDKLSEIVSNINEADEEISQLLKKLNSY